MKPVILAGTPRSGKTKLAKMLQQKTGFSLLSGDAIVCSFGGIFPQLEIVQDANFETTSKNLQPFLRAYLEQMDVYQHIPFILDIFHLLPEYVTEQKLHEKYQVFFLGYPDIAPDEKLKNIRTHKSGMYDWTDERSDENLQESIIQFIAHSQQIRKSCSKLGLEFIDTGYDFEKAINTIYQNILERS